MTKIDITSSLAEKGIESVQIFLEKLLGPAVSEVGLLLADKVRVYRLTNQIKIFSKVKDKVEKNNLTLKQVSLRTLVPLLEYSSLENDEKIQEKWINLTVNFIDAKEKYESSIYPYLLSQLSSIEIQVLDRMYSDFKVNCYSKLKINGAIKSNLIRLGLVETVVNRRILKRLSIINQGSANMVVLTDLGKEFIECCSSKFE